MPSHECIEKDIAKKQISVSVFFALMFLGVMIAVSLIEQAVSVRPSDVLHQLQRSEQNVSKQIDRLETMIRDHAMSAETGEDSHQRLK